MLSILTGFKRAHLQDSLDNVAPELHVSPNFILFDCAFDKMFSLCANDPNSMNEVFLMWMHENRKLGNFRKTRKSQVIQIHKADASQAVGIRVITHPFQRADTCVRDPALAPFLERCQGVGCIQDHVVVSCLAILLFI